MILIIDTETTGREPPEVIEFAGAWLDVFELTIPAVDFQARYCPKEESCFGALATHHIFRQDVQHEPPSEECQLPGGTEYIVGHNVDYDWKALGSPKVKRICTLAMARKLYPDCDSHSLGAMLYRLAPNRREARGMLKDAHSAAADVKMCALILQWMAVDNNLTFLSGEDLWEYSEGCRIPTIWTFGKFKGEPIEAADRGYLQWCLRQPDFDPYVLQAVKKALGR